MAAGKQADDNDGNDTDLARKIDRVRDNVKQFASSASESAAGGVKALVDQGAERAKAAANRLPDATHWADDQLDLAREKVRAEPIKMMAIAAGVGALFGLLFLRR